MNRGMVNSLPDSERLLVLETEPAALAQLSEDDLVELHQRIRRQRNKYVGLYRREASARVRAQGGRGKARPKNARNRDRAEVFEDALSRVSRALAAAAKASAAELRAERIEAARAAKAGAKPAADRTSTPARPAAPRAARKAPNAKKGDRAVVSPRSIAKGADSRAAGQRRQGRKDARTSAARSR
jgi:hypothetical protein